MCCSEQSDQPSYLVADIVASRVHLEQLQAPLLIYANDDGHHSRRPHVCMLQHTYTKSQWYGHPQNPVPKSF